jgi:hypothetical protein
MGKKRKKKKERKEKKNLLLGMNIPEGTMQIEPVYKTCLEQMWNASSHLGSPRSHTDYGHVVQHTCLLAQVYGQTGVTTGSK